jgi:BirA family biotin operon repressor/biotin-[acetyl-CoA-carboxylase] ligase
MRIGGCLHARQSCESTNDLARDLALSGAEEGTAVTARTQTRGRGTKGRGWYSPPGQGLYLSVILRPGRADFPLLPLASGLGVRAGLLEVTSLPVRLKWPNDIVWEGKKLGGILCEARCGPGPDRFAVLGIGLNLIQQETDFPGELRGRAASLCMAGGWDGDEPRLLSAIFDGLDRWYGALKEGRNSEILGAYRDAASFAPGAVLTVRRADGGAVQGRWAGFDDRGGLVLDSPGGRAVLISADEIAVEEAG